MRAWQPTPVFLPGEFHGQKSLGGYSPWSHKELDTTERPTPCFYSGRDFPWTPSLPPALSTWRTPRYPSKPCSRVPPFCPRGVWTCPRRNCSRLWAPMSLLNSCVSPAPFSPELSFLLLYLPLSLDWAPWGQKEWWAHPLTAPKVGKRWRKAAKIPTPSRDSNPPLRTPRSLPKTLISNLKCESVNINILQPQPQQSAISTPKYSDPKIPKYVSWCWENLKAREGTTEDEMVGWHHQLNGHGFE